MGLLSSSVKVPQLLESILAGDDSPIRLPCVSTQAHADVAAWLICTRLKQVHMLLLLFVMRSSEGHIYVQSAHSV